MTASSPDWIFTLADVAAALPPEAQAMRYSDAFKHGTLRLGLYAPRGPDIQTPHKQDELYVVVSGSGWFAKNGERRPFKSHDVIFVEAGADHRFEELSSDFAAWVVFWGPDGGER